MGATWCGYTQKAWADLNQVGAATTALDPQFLVQQYPVNQVITPVMCDQSAVGQVSQKDMLCGLAKRGYPVLVACEQAQCSIILDGYFPDYAASSARAINQALSAGA